MDDPLKKAQTATASVAAQEGAALKRRKQFKKMNATIALASLTVALIIAQTTQTTQTVGGLMESPARHFVWIFILSGLVGVFAEFYFVWLQDKEDNKTSETIGKP
ncbi:MAG: hypothetical protein HOO93_04990 [Methyloglobulus sp.]|nr:hypothetical protein [Methyloglobulus sp.]